MNLSHFWDDWPTRLALLGLVFVILYALVMGRYMATHYTRVPGGRWTTWDKAVTSAPSSVSEEERAA